jgi:opacity protein-like surface antigen
MKRAAVLLVAGFVSVLFLATASFAASLPNYFVVKAGIFEPQGDDIDDFDTGFNGEIAFGRYITPNIALELGLGYFQTDGPDFFDPTLGTVSTELDAVNVKLSGRALFPIGKFEPFVEVGVGVYFVDLEIAVLGLTISDDDTAFGFHLGLGANFNVTPNVFLGVEGRYIFLEPKFSGIDVESDGITVTANLGYRF